MSWILSKLFPVKRTPYSEIVARSQRAAERYYALINSTYGEFPRPRLN